MNAEKGKKLLILNLPYIVIGLLATNVGEMWRMAQGITASEKLQRIVLDGLIMRAFENPFPSIYPSDILIGVLFGLGIKLAV